MYELIEFRADEFMTFPVVTVGPEAPMRNALSIFDRHDFNCIPVADGGRLLGVLSKLDVLKAFASTNGQSYGEILDGTVESVMNPKPRTVSSDALLSEVIATMVATGFKAFPVMRGAELVGIITREDAVRAIECVAAGKSEALGGKARAGGPRARPALLRDVAEHLGCGRQQAQGLTAAVFRELRDRLTPRESAHVAAQLSEPLRRIWAEDDRPGRSVRRIHKEEFLGRVRRRAGLSDDAEAEKIVRVVFRALQRTLGSPTGREGVSWDVFSQLPKDMKALWLDTATHAVLAPRRPVQR